jgi:hypothetical protein
VTLGEPFRRTARRVTAKPVLTIVRDQA